MKKGFFLLLGLLIFSVIHSQPSVLAKNNGASMERVGKDIYAIIHDDATDEWPHGNTGVIIGSNAVMVIDACYLPSMAREDIRLIRSVTKKPVKYLVFTHWHFDHNNGTIAYKDSFPGITIISERESQKFIELNAVWWSRRSAANGSTKRIGLAGLEAQLASGKDTSGTLLSKEKLDKLRQTVSQRQNELKELSELKVITPDKTFDGLMTVDLGNKKVEIRDRGKANSPHDVTIYLPNEQVLFTGDILVQSPLPYLGASWPVAWVKVLSQLEKIPIKAMVMGHGPVQKDHRYTRQVREFLETAMKKVEALIRQGKTIEQVQETISMDEFKKGAWDPSNEGFLENDWKYNLNTIVERIWRGIRGQG